MEENVNQPLNINMFCGPGVNFNNIFEHLLCWKVRGFFGVQFLHHSTAIGTIVRISSLWLQPELYCEISVQLLVKQNGAFSDIWQMLGPSFALCTIRLVKLATSVNFSNILRAAFLYKSVSAAFMCSPFGSHNFMAKGNWRKICL